MHAFEVGEHDISVQRMTMLDPRVFDYVVCDSVPVLTGEVTSTTRASLRIRHPRRMAWNLPGRRAVALGSALFTASGFPEYPYQARTRASQGRSVAPTKAAEQSDQLRAYGLEFEYTRRGRIRTPVWRSTAKTSSNSAQSSAIPPTAAA